MSSVFLICFSLSKYLNDVILRKINYNLLILKIFVMKKLVYLIMLCLCILACSSNKSNDQFVLKSGLKQTQQMLADSVYLDNDEQYVNYLSSEEAVMVAEYFIGSAEYIQSVDSVPFSYFFPAFQMMLPAMLNDYDLSPFEGCTEYYAPANILYIVSVNRPDFTGSVLVSGIHNQVSPAIGAFQGVYIQPDIFDLNSFVQNYSSQVEAATTYDVLTSFYSEWSHNNGNSDLPDYLLTKLLRLVFIEFFNQFCWQCNEPAIPCDDNIICNHSYRVISDDVLYFEYRDCDSYLTYSSFAIALLKVYKHEQFPYYSSSVIDETNLDCAVLSNITYGTTAYPNISTLELLTDTTIVKSYLLQRDLLISSIDVSEAIDEIRHGKLVLVECNGRWGVAYNLYYWCDPCGDNDRIALIANFDYNILIPNNTMSRIVETIDVSESEGGYHYFRYEPYFSGSTFGHQQNQ